MIGAIIGDIIGSTYEFHNFKELDFELFTYKSRFTDDSVLTIAVADALMHNKSYVESFQTWGKKYFDCGFSSTFRKWFCEKDPQPYFSYGNGAGMRVSPVGWVFDTLEETLNEAKRTAAVSHNHPEGIKGAQAIASSIYLARIGKSKQEIRDFVENTFQYDLNRTIDEIRPNYYFELSCQKSVPESIIAFLESTDYESAVRLAVSLGGDSDTQACMAGSIAEAFYKTIPATIVEQAKDILSEDILNIIDEFEPYKIPAV